MQPESDLATTRSSSSPESPIPNPQPIPNASRIDGYIIAGTALQLRGTPYRLGGADPETGFDCSGLVQYVFGHFGITVPRDVRSQYGAIHRIGNGDIQPGDLLFFVTEGDDVSHVAIAISSNQFVHSPNSRGVVRVETLKSDYWAPRYVGAARVIDTSTASDVGGIEPLDVSQPSSETVNPKSQIPTPESDSRIPSP